jgi:hypothetical protein
MRYFKGYIGISDDRDVPMLLHLRNARAVTFSQMCDLLELDGVERLRRSVHWRLKRLQQNGLIQRFDQDRFLGQPVFAITTVGLQVLESRGHHLASLPSTTDQIIHRTQLLHAIELVNIRLALARGGVLLSWKCELEITAHNLVLETGRAKDYDALAEICVDGNPKTFAIEYERTIKASARYKEIRELLGRDSTVDVVLYLASDHNVLYLLAVEMRGLAKHVGLALSENFRRDLLDARTLLPSENSDVVPFRELFVA